MAGSTQIGQPIRFDLDSERANEMLMKPLFVSENIITADWIKWMRNVKTSATMFFAGVMEEIVQKNNGCGWNPQGKMPITQREIEVSKHCVQMELCTDEFWGTCLEELTGQGIDIFKLDATELGERVLEILLERIVQSIANDLFKLAFFGDTASTLPFFAQLDGWNKIIEADIVAGLTPATVPTGSGAPLADGASLTIFEDMYDAQSDELDDIEDAQKVLIVSKSIYKNFKKFLQSNPTCCDAWRAIQEGIEMLFYNGIPVVKCPQFDKCDAKLGGVDVHRAYLVYTQTLAGATDVNGSDTSLTVRFDERTKLHEIETYFRLGFNVAHPELVVYAK